MSATSEIQNYLETYGELQESWSKNGGVWATDLRQRAIDRFRELGFPTTRHEAWKYTSLKDLEGLRFRPAPRSQVDSVGEADLVGAPFSESSCHRLVFVDGHFSPRLSTPALTENGIEVRSLGQAAHEDQGEVEARLGKQADFADHPFVALNTAFMEDGALIRLDRGTFLERPIYLLFLSTAVSDPLLGSPRILIEAGEGSQCTIIEDYTGLGDDVGFTNVVTEARLGPRAHVDHYKLERENDRSFHLASLAIRQEASSNFRSHSISLGGRLVRNDICSVLDGEGVKCTLNGLIIASGMQHMDNHTRIVHARPNCNSFETYKAILDDRARGVFNGKIYVAKDAQKTDAFQKNKTLILSEEAAMNTKPELEIYADDVKCSHGATIGQLDEDSLFYLRSRGLDCDTAESLLTYAFASDVLSDIRLDAVRNAIQTMVFDKLPSEQSMELARELGEGDQS